MKLLNHKLICGSLYEKISDHVPNFLIIKDISNVRQISKITARDMKNFNQEKYLNHLKEFENLCLVGTNTKYQMTNINQNYLIL